MKSHNSAEIPTDSPLAYARWLLVSLYALGLLILSVISLSDLSLETLRDIPGGHITRHVIGYAVLTLLLNYTMRSEVDRGLFRRSILAFMLAVLYGGALEGAQIFLSSRNACWMDAGYNVIGALAGCAIWIIARWGFANKSKKS